MLLDHVCLSSSASTVDWRSGWVETRACCSWSKRTWWGERHVLGHSLLFDLTRPCFKWWLYQLITRALMYACLGKHTPLWTQTRVHRPKPSLPKYVLHFLVQLQRLLCCTKAVIKGVCLIVQREVLSSLHCSAGNTPWGWSTDLSVTFLLWSFVFVEVESMEFWITLFAIILTKVCLLWTFLDLPAVLYVVSQLTRLVEGQTELREELQRRGDEVIHGIVKHSSMRFWQDDSFWIVFCHKWRNSYFCGCVCVCVCLWARACVRVGMHAWVCVRVRTNSHVLPHIHTPSHVQRQSQKHSPGSRPEVIFFSLKSSSSWNSLK